MDVSVTTPDTVTVNDCEAVADALSVAFTVNEYVPIALVKPSITYSEPPLSARDVIPPGIVPEYETLYGGVPASTAHDRLYALPSTIELGNELVLQFSDNCALAGVVITPTATNKSPQENFVKIAICLF